MKKKTTYRGAIERLKEIVNQIDAGELDIDELGARIKEAKELIDCCNEKLTNADREVEILLSENDNERN